MCESVKMTETLYNTRLRHLFNEEESATGANTDVTLVYIVHGSANKFGIFSYIHTLLALRTRSEEWARLCPTAATCQEVPLEFAKADKTRIIGIHRLDHFLDLSRVR